MNSLNKALSDISSIRRQVAHSTEFRGYGPATLASTGILAFAAAGAQALWLPDPANHMPTYLSIWIVAAALSATMIGIEMYARTRRIHSGMADEMIRMAVEQFLPSVGAGALITLVLVRYVPAVLWMLPGLWQIVFSLGVFSSCRFLPRPVAAVGAWYLLTGLTCIALGGRPGTLSVGHGYPVWSRAVAGRGDTAFYREGGKAMKAKAPRSEGRFAYEGLDRVIHERARLSVLTSLITHPKGLTFGELKQLCALTDGNLNRHLRVLERSKDGRDREET